MDGNTSLIAEPLQARAVVEAPIQEASQVFHDAWGAILRRRSLVLMIFALIVAVGLTVVLTRPRLYEATSILMMSPREPEGVVTTQDTTFRPPDTGYVDSQLDILESPALAGVLVDRLHLNRDPEWTQHGSDRADVIASVQKAISAKRREQTYIVEVGVRSVSAQKAALMSNALVDIYLASRAQARVQASQRTSDWLRQRLVELGNEVQTKEAAVESFRAQSGLLAAGGVPLTEQRVQQAEAAALAAQVDVAEHTARWRQAQQLGGGSAAQTLSGALTSEVMTQLRAREADVDRRLSEYNDRYGDQHPLVIAARAEKADIERQIGAEVNRLSAGLHNEADIAQARSSALQGELSAARASLAQSNTQVVQLNDLDRQAASARAVFNSFQQRYNELADGAAGVGNDAQLVAVASPPSKPVSRSIPLLLFLMTAAGLAAGVFTALMVEKLSPLVQTPEDIERSLGLPVLTTIPALGGRDFDRLARPERHPGGFAVARPRSAFTESIRLLRARVARSSGNISGQIVAVASSLPREGKTTTALCLARVAAMSGKRVMLLDCDLRNGSLHVLLGCEPKQGILEVLRGDVNWRDIVGADASGAHVIPTTGDCFTPEDIFGSQAMRGFLDELSSEYDLIVLDCPPVLTLAEARELAGLASSTVLVARRGKTASHALRVAYAELVAGGANVVGVALNGVNMNAPGYSSYGDPLYFSRAQRGMYTSG